MYNRIHKVQREGMSQSLPTDLDSLGTALYSGPTPAAVVTPKPAIWAARTNRSTPTATVTTTTTTAAGATSHKPAATATATAAPKAGPISSGAGAAPNTAPAPNSALASAIAARPALGDAQPIAPTATGSAGAAVDVKSLQTSAGSSDASSVKHIVLDSAAMITGSLRLGQYGAAVRYYTVRGVLNELKDKRAQAWIQSFPYKIEEREVSRSDLAAVTEFATLTGDVHVLSQTDLSVLALTLAIEREQHGATRIRNKPVHIHCIASHRIALTDCDLLMFCVCVFHVCS